jgi:hypothetical protein
MRSNNARERGPAFGDDRGSGRDGRHDRFAHRHWLRDKLIHDYFGVDLTLVWGVAERELPTLRPRIAALLESIIE